MTILAAVLTFFLFAVGIGVLGEAVLPIQD